MRSVLRYSRVCVVLSVMLLAFGLLAATQLSLASYTQRPVSTAAVDGGRRAVVRRQRVAGRCDSVG